MSLTLSRYTPALSADWDALASSSGCAPFLFRRGYMDYHADRFRDASYVFADSRTGALRAAIPGSLSDDGRVWTSHGGLTYGGLFGDVQLRAEEVMEAYRLLDADLGARGVVDAEVKPVPWIYCTVPSEAQLWALHWALGARLSRRDLSTAILLPGRGDQPRWQGRRLRGARKAAAMGCRAEADRPLADFWPVLVDNLRERFGVAPVHSLAEMELLQGRFPDNIRLVTVADSVGAVLAGTVLYLAGPCVHAQYISASPQGKAAGALDLLFQALLPEDRFGLLGGRACFDFGRSTEGPGDIVNHGLLDQKEGFGARAVCYDAYAWHPAIPR